MSSASEERGMSMAVDVERREGRLGKSTRAIPKK